MFKQLSYLFVCAFLLFLSANAIFAQEELTVPADDSNGIVLEEKEVADAEPALEESQTQTMPQTQENIFLNFNKVWMLAPMRTGHKNGVYSLAGYGRMEAARTLDPESIQAGFNFLLAGFGGEEDNDPNFDGTLTMLELEGRYGIIDNFEAGLRIPIGGWEGTLEVYNLPLNSETGTTLGDVILHAKYKFIGENAVLDLDSSLAFDVAGLLTLKLPTGSQDDVMSTGGFDFSLNILSSIYPTEEIAINIMLGITVAGDGDTVQPQENRLWGTLFSFGIGGAYKVNDMLSIVLQTEFYDPAMDLTLGAKAFFEAAGVKLFPELGFTYGLYNQAADYTLLLSLTILF